MATAKVKISDSGFAHINGVVIGTVTQNPKAKTQYVATNKAGNRTQIVVGKNQALDTLLTWHNEALAAEAAAQAEAEAAYYAEQQAAAPAPAPEAEPAPADDSAAQAAAELADVATQSDFQQWSDKWQAYTLVRKADGAALAAVAHWGDKKGREIAEFSLDNGKTSYPYYDQIAKYFNVALLQPK